MHPTQVFGPRIQPHLIRRVSKPGPFLVSPPLKMVSLSTISEGILSTARVVTSVTFMVGYGTVVEEDVGGVSVSVLATIFF